MMVGWLFDGGRLTADAIPLDLRVYLITDPRLIGVRPLPEVVAAAIRGGVTIVQLRDKQATTLQLLEMAGRLREITQPMGVPLIVNDRVDVALAAGASGVHVGHPGQEDLLPELCRRLLGQLLGPAAIVGVSADTERDVRAAEAAGASYLGVGPMHSTTTKADAGRAAGSGLIVQIRALTALPLVGVGGITAATAGEVIAAGADGVAVAGAVLAAYDPEAAARTLRAAVDDALARRK